jgi:hypothetical protein
MDLANIIPAGSAFNIKVNSAARSVSSVAVSGSKVRLTLATAVTNGDIITVTYSKPAANPLQSASGGEVASVSEQLVINNVTASPSVPIPNNTRMTIYPNPAHKFISILLENLEQEAGLSPGIIRIFDISGKLFLEKLIETGVANLQFPINFKPGLYAVVIFSGNLVLSSQNIIVN